MNWTKLMKSELPKNTDYYHNFILKKMLTMFTWDGLPSNQANRFIDTNLYIWGTIGAIVHNGELTIVQGAYSGNVDTYGIGTDYTYCNVGLSGTGIVGTDIAVCHNDRLISSMYPFIDKYADLLAQVDTSIKIAILNTRLTNIVSAHNDIEKMQIETAMQSMYLGNPAVVVRSMDEEFGEDQPWQTITLRDTKTTPELPTILQARDEILSTMFCELGMSLNTKMKKAQVISEELEGYTDVSRISILDMLYERQLFCERVNDLFGTNLSVRISDQYDVDTADDDPSNEPSNEPSDEPEEGGNDNE